MNRLPTTVIFLPGAGGRQTDRYYDVGFGVVGALLKEREGDSIRFERIGYPDWRRFVTDGFSAEVLISELVEQIVAKVPEGPVWLVGWSLGGHFGYACALRLEEIGRQIAGLCAIDTFMVTSSEPRPGWQRRNLDGALRLFRNGRFRELRTFVRERFWRIQLRLLLAKAPALLRSLAYSERWPALIALDPVLEEELNLRLMMREAAPWIASLDRDPVAVPGSAALIRTQDTAGDDPAWRRRCPNIEIIETDGEHTTLLDPENVGSFRKAFVAATHNWRWGVGE